MKPKTKAKKPAKAITLLTKIEALLCDVLAECSAFEKGVEKNVRGLLRTAEASIEAAKDYFTPAAPPKARPKKVTAKRRAPAPAVKRAAKRATPVKHRAVVVRRPENAALPVPLTNVAAPAAPISAL